MGKIKLFHCLTFLIHVGFEVVRRHFLLRRVNFRIPMNHQMNPPLLLQNLIADILKNLLYVLASGFLPYSSLGSMSAV